MSMSYSMQRSLISEPTSYLPSVRPAFEFPPGADAMVQRWRRMGAAWQAIAGNFGCSVDLVRKAWDPSYIPAHAPAVPLVAPRPSGPAPRPVDRRSYQFDILAALEDGELTRAQLGERVQARPNDFHRLIGALKGKLLLDEPRHNVFALTAAGRAELKRHLDIDAGRETRCVSQRGVPRSDDNRHARELRILAALLDGPLSPRKLSDREAIPFDSVRVILRALRAEGDVRFMRNANVGYGGEWALTDQGRANVEAARRG